MRILLKDFVYNEAIPCYLTSKKVKKEVMVHNYHALRIILNEILNFNRWRNDYLFLICIL